MKARLLFVVCGWLFATPVVADAVEVFLLTTQENHIKNLELASEQGHTITYYYLDAQEVIEKQLSKEVEVALSRLFNRALNERSTAELSTLGDEGITQRVMELIATDSEFLQQADVMKSVANDPDIKAALMRAEEDKQRAKAFGIQRQDLPVVVFKEWTFPNVSDLKKVLSSGDSK